VSWTAAPRWQPTSTSPDRPDYQSSSVTRTAPGNAERTRTPTASSASTSRKAQIYPDTHPQLPTPQNTRLENSCRKHCKMCYIFVIQPVLRRPVESAQFTSWAFGRRLVDAGLVPSMGSIGDCYDNSLMESFWGTMQLELLDSRIWATRAELATAILSG
jgi:hypothetical protein